MTVKQKTTTITVIGAVMALIAALVAIGVVPKASDIMTVGEAKAAHESLEHDIERNEDRIIEMQREILKAIREAHSGD